MQQLHFLRHHQGAEFAREADDEIGVRELRFPPGGRVDQGADGPPCIGDRSACSDVSMSSTTTSRARRASVREYSWTIRSRVPAIARHGMSGCAALNARLMFFAGSPITAMEQVIDRHVHRPGGERREIMSPTHSLSPRAIRSVRAIVAACNGAKHRQMTHPAAAKLRFVRRDPLPHGVKSVGRHDACRGFPSARTG